MSSQNALAVISSINSQISPLAKQSKHVGQELGQGIAAPFAVIGYKGGKWSIRHRGNTTLLMKYDDQGRLEGPMAYIELVILLAASHHSKVYYAKAYQDGDDDVPDCWSTDGVKPDSAAPHKQHPQCHDCRHNAFGSRTNAATGAKGKACADTRRMAVVPYKDITNTVLGGPMLLRVPPASLGAVGEYSDLLKANSVPYFALATRVGFDPREAYPKMTFEPYSALTDAQMADVLKMQAHPLTERIVQEQIENMVAQPGSEQGTNQSAPEAKQGPQTDPGSDPGPIPEHLRRGNGAAPAASAASVNQPVTSQVSNTNNNPFAQGANTGPSYPGNQPATGAPAEVAPPATQPAENAPAATAAPATPGLTAEQARILELEQKLAAAEAAAKAPKQRKARTPPVAPSGTAEPATQANIGAAFGGAPAKTEAQIAASLPGETIVQPEGEEDGSGTGAVVAPGDPVLSSISERLSKIL